MCSFAAVGNPRACPFFCELGVLTCFHVLEHAPRLPPPGARLTLCSHVQLPPLLQALARVAVVAGPIVGRAVVDAYKQAMISASRHPRDTRASLSEVPCLAPQYPPTLIAHCGEADARHNAAVKA